MLPECGKDVGAVRMFVYFGCLFRLFRLFLMVASFCAGWRFYQKAVRLLFDSATSRTDIR